MALVDAREATNRDLPEVHGRGPSAPVPLRLPGVPSGPGPSEPPSPAGPSLAGMVLPDARTGERLDLGAGPALGLLVLIRHRY